MRATKNPRSRKTSGIEPRESVAQTGETRLPEPGTFRKPPFGRPPGTGNAPSYKVPRSVQVEIGLRELATIKNQAARIEHERREREQRRAYEGFDNYLKSVLDLPITPQEYVYGSGSGI